MPFGWWSYWPSYDAPVAEQPRPRQGKRRGVTQSPKRAKRRNRRKP